MEVFALSERNKNVVGGGVCTELAYDCAGASTLSLFCVEKKRAIRVRKKNLCKLQKKISEPENAKIRTSQKFDEGNPDA